MFKSTIQRNQRVLVSYLFLKTYQLYDFHVYFPDGICERMKHIIAWCCEKTSLHGFHYISSKESSVFTRVFFACVSCCSFMLCSYLIYLQLAEREQQSVVTTVRSTAYPVWKIHFPSVTVCNFNLVYKDNIKNVMNAM